MMDKKWMIAVAVCAIAGAAIAEPAPVASRAGWDPATMQKHNADMEVRRADDMAVLIGLRADQRPAFDLFLRSMKPSWARLDAGSDPRPARAPLKDANFSARLDAMQGLADRRDAAIKQRIAAARQFYASLTLDQQQRFDALERLRHEHGREHRFGMRGFRSPGAPPAPPSAG